MRVCCYFVRVIDVHNHIMFYTNYIEFSHLVWFSPFLI